jgi:hypothetical protein
MTQLSSENRLNHVDWWTMIGHEYTKDLDQRKDAYHYNEKGEFVGLEKLDSSDSETRNSSQRSYTDADTKAETF